VSDLVEQVLDLERRMKTIAAARDRLVAGRQYDDLESQRQKLDDRRGALLAKASDRELVALELGREAFQSRSRWDAVVTGASNSTLPR
jgi:hypothetical protein